jgi:hypothetical protein
VKLDYLLITEAKILDADDKVIDEMPSLPCPLQPSMIFNYQNLLIDKPKAASFLVKIYDPNQNKTTEY